MFFSAACVRELLEINQKCNIGVKGESILFQNKLILLLYRVAPLALDQNFPTLIEVPHHTFDNRNTVNK